MITGSEALDIDSVSNGTIVDPTGLAERPSNLAATGQSPLPWITGGLAAIGFLLYLRRDNKLGHSAS